MSGHVFFASPAQKDLVQDKGAGRRDRGLVFLESEKAYFLFFDPNFRPHK